MPYAIELFLDADVDQRIREMWAALDANGIPSLGYTPRSNYHPHVSLSVFDCEDISPVARALEPVAAGAIGLPITFASLGFFLTDEAPAFLGVLPTSRLLDLHRHLDESVDPLAPDVWPYYRPDALLPHCSLALRVTDRARLLDVAAKFTLPIEATVASVQLVQIPGGHRRRRLAPLRRFDS